MAVLQFSALQNLFFSHKEDLQKLLDFALENFYLFPLFLLLLYFFMFCPLLQAVMPSPVSELRSPNIKYHEASFLEDYPFQQATPSISALRDPVSNRVTLVG